MQEVEILKELKHPNIIEYCGYFTGYDFGNSLLTSSQAQIDDDGQEPCEEVLFWWKGMCLHIIMEFADGGDV